MKRFYVAATLLLLLGSLAVLAQTKPEGQKKETDAELADRLKKPLGPSKEERLKYQAFLKAKNTGLVRLLPREKYDTPALQRINRNPVSPASLPRTSLDDIRDRTALKDAADVPRVNTMDPSAKSPVVGKKSGDVRGGGAFYSFTQGTHEYGYATDVTLDQGKFGVGFYGASYGFLTDLGNVELETIDLDTPAVKPLAAYKPVYLEADARRESRRFGQGDQIDGVTVKSRVPMQLNSTYVLRAVNYDEADVLVAFKVVDIDSDGSALLLWKRLKRYSTPQLSPLGSLTVVARAQSSKDQKKAAEAKRAEFKKKSKTLLASKADRAKYADFLKAPNTGLIRLLPRERFIHEAYVDPKKKAVPASLSSFPRYDSHDLTSSVPGAMTPERGPSGSNSVSGPSLTNVRDLPSVDPAQPDNRGRARDGGAYYSFVRLTHEYGYGSDLSLEYGQFGVGFAGADYGFITNLGDVPLESITLDTPEAKRLGAYARAKQESDARAEKRRFDKGAEIDGVKVKSRVPMRANSTYLLRSINYDESDVLVAFKVVEIDSEGTPLILWKRLKRYTTPPLAGN
ncbi:MAG TPA: hypothetical protein VGD38_01130 [Pyrinomonadaceae bacterium]